MEGKGEIIIYQTEDGKSKLEAQPEQDSIWLTSAQMSALFKKPTLPAIGRIDNLFKEGELEKAPVVRNVRTTGAFFILWQHKVNLCIKKV